MRDIGKNIKQLRQMKNMTQDELAEKLFVTRQTVSNYETGKSRPDIEMLTQIAETLDTDPNTVLYGLPQQVNRERKIQKLCICAAALVILWIGYTYLASLANDLASTHYDMRLSFLCRYVAGPILVLLNSWTVLQALQVFAKLSPMQDPLAKRLRLAVIIAAALYVILILPVLTFCWFAFDFTSALPDFIRVPWSYVTFWLSGYLPNMYIRPNLVLFGILGCVLWLGTPPRTKGS